MSIDEIRFIHYTDVHLQAGNPPSRIGSYRDDLLDKLRHIAELSVEHKVNFTVCGGDLFHHKKPVSTPHSLVVDTMEMLHSTGVPNFIVPGNHDMQYDSMDTLAEQPLGVLLQAGVLRQMKDQEITSGTLKVKLWSHPFEEQPDLGQLMMTGEGQADVNILGIHIYSAPLGGKLFGTRIYSYEDLAVTGHDIYLMGHYHADNGVTQTREYTDKEQTFVNIGSLSRGDYGDETVSRTPKCCLVTIKKEKGKSTITYKVIAVRSKPASEVFDLDKKEKIEKQKVETAAFVQELQTAAVRLDNDKPLEDDLTELISEKDVMDLAIHYLNLGYQATTGSKK